MTPQHIPTTLIDTLSTTVSALRQANRDAQAQRWLSVMQPRLAPFTAQKEGLGLLERIRLEAALAGLPAELVLALIQVESAFDALAISSAGAQGLMQIMPFWKDVIGRPEDDLFDPDLNLRYGCTILAHYLRVEDGDLTRALARYNGSLGQTWYPERVMKAWATRWRLSSDEESNHLTRRHQE
ncbi:lytic transglycosylase domain-containing protein [Halomonas sp. GXIMD04776]|uniref:lytic transglycosylase domain-containing protein n=1 Tax=Halomonas sp. GXIMD04776 TaxID=3415605 RepID=UPI003CC2EC9D